MVLENCTGSFGTGGSEGRNVNLFYFPSRGSLRLMAFDTLPDEHKRQFKCMTEVDYMKFFKVKRKDDYGQIMVKSMGSCILL